MNWLEKDQKYVWHPYTQMKTAAAPLPIVKGEGVWLIDESGNRYIDAISSWWVNIHGHAHPYIAQRVYEQFLQLEHVIFAGFTHPPAIQLSEKLIALLPENQAKVFFSDNGSTAVEIGMKMALQYFHNQGKARKKIIAFDEAFHGETFGAMSASGDHDFNTAFLQHLFEVDRIPAPLPGKEQETYDRLEELLKGEDVCAFIFEPLVMGAGGMLMYEAAALDRLIALCHQYGTLCIADEVMTGFYRTGRLFASDYLEEKPDIMALSKGLTGGNLPLSVTTCTEEIFQAFWSDDKKKAFFHGHSYTANPLGCAAALASMELVQGENCKHQVAMIAEQHSQFKDSITGHPAIKDIRQTGTILAIEFKTKEQTSYFNSLRDHLYHFFLDKGLLLRPLGNVIYILPPYCISEKELGRIYKAIEEALEWLANNA